MANVKVPGTNINQVQITDTVKQVPSIEYNQAVRQRMVANAKYRVVNGFNPDVDTAASESIWSGGGVFTFLDAPELINIVSDSTDDDAGGLGALTVLVSGLGSDGLVLEETVIMNGTTNVPTTNQYIHIQDLIVATAGVSRGSVGNITATGVTSTLKVAESLIGDNRSSNGHFMVPSDEIWLLVDFVVSASRQQASAIDGKSIVSTAGGIARTGTIFGISSQGAALQLVSIEAGEEFTPGTQLKVNVNTSTNTTAVSVRFGFLAIKFGS